MENNEPESLRETNSCCFMCLYSDDIDNNITFSNIICQIHGFEMTKNRSKYQVCDDYYFGDKY